MPEETWISVMTYSDRLSVQAGLELLATEGLPCYVASDEFVPGLGQRFALRVPREFAGKAAALLAQSPVSDQELIDLALSEPMADQEGN
jgi:hypothetical protein